jgi:hypothetical protein
MGNRRKALALIFPPLLWPGRILLQPAAALGRQLATFAYGLSPGVESQNSYRQLAGDDVRAAPPLNAMRTVGHLSKSAHHQWMTTMAAPLIKLAAAPHQARGQVTKDEHERPRRDEVESRHNVARIFPSAYFCQINKQFCKTVNKPPAQGKPQLPSKSKRRFGRQTHNVLELAAT